VAISLHSLAVAVQGIDAGGSRLSLTTNAEVITEDSTDRQGLTTQRLHIDQRVCVTRSVAIRSQRDDQDASERNLLIAAYLA
jgi:hypothetical protein